MASEAAEVEVMIIFQQAEKVDIRLAYSLLSNRDQCL
jgi:hypothetical protein